ncbi:MAG: FAD:protein FMN transferase [Pseudomonadota bacterium]
MTDLTKLSRRTFMVMPLALAACQPGAEEFDIVGATMGTTYRVVAADPSGRVDQAAMRGAIDTALANVNRTMSNWDETSEISRFNAMRGTEAITVSAELAEVMQAAEAVHAASAGRFDTTMGPVIELWGFGAPRASGIPGDAAIEAARARAGHAHTLAVGDGTLRKKLPEAQVYLAAIGKGYGADAVARAIEGFGIRDYMVEIGGDLYVSGRNPDGLEWRIGIEMPAAGTRDVLEVVSVSDLGLASSGDYRNYFERDGQRFSHLLDPTTGRPVTHETAAVTVLAENAMMADAWATALHVLGTEAGMEIAEARGLAALFVERDGAARGFRTRASSAFTARTGLG